MEHLMSFKQQYDPLFISYLKEKIDSCSKRIPFLGGLGNHLISYASGGKRLRPFVAFSASGMDTTMLPDSYILPVLHALELYHLFALIHDDIIDRSDTRHGMQAMHERFGMSLAILIGDLCLSWAHECMIAVHDDEGFIQMMFSSLSEETIVGQMIDVELSKPGLVTEERIDQMIELKTSKYTFIYPMVLGFIFQPSAKPDPSSILRFGRALGSAFQRIDNMADIVLDERELGKAPGTDFRNGIPSHITQFIQTFGSSDDRERYYALFRNPNADTEAIRALVLSSGAYDHERESIQNLLEQAWDSCPSKYLERCVSVIEERFNML
jgi:geranylgeranyl diphosphate synthase, type I